MPTVNRVMPKARAAPARTKSTVATPLGQGVLGRIVPVSQITSGIKMNVYGRGKTGKTRLACSFPKPVLIIGTEDGTKSVKNVPQVDYVRLGHSSELAELTAMLRQRTYETVAIDTAGGLQDLILKEVLGLDDVPIDKFKKAGKGEAWGLADKGTWGVVGNQWKTRMRSVMRLAEEVGLNVVVIAHERNFKEEGDSDVMLPSVGAALTPGVAGWLNAECDYVAQTFIMEETSTAPAPVAVAGAPANVITVKTGKKQYCLRVGPHPVFMTGFRLPDGVELPEYIVDPTYDKVAALIEGS